MITDTFRKNSRFFLLATLFFLIVCAVYFFRSVIMPFALGAFLAYLLAPIISRLTKIKVRKFPVPRGVAILLVYAFGIGLLTLLGLVLVPKLTVEVNGLVRDLPRILKDLERGWVMPAEQRINEWLSEFFPRQTLPPPVEPPATPEKVEAGQPAAPTPNGEKSLEELLTDYTYVVRRLENDRFEISPKIKGDPKKKDDNGNLDFSRPFSLTFQQFRQQFQDNIVELLRLSRRYLFAVVGSFFSTFMVLMISAFILVEPSRLPNFLRGLVPARHHAAFGEFMVALDHGLSGVVRGQVMICLINGILTGIGIAIIGVPFVFTLSLIATLFSLIPIFGVLISTIPIILLGLTVSITTAVVALAWILIIHFFEGNFLNPKILGDSARIHPVLIVFALVAGEFLGGIMGALLAVPVFSLVQNSFLFLKALAERVETAS